MLDLEVVCLHHDPLLLYCDNSGATINTSEPRRNQHGKHIK